MRIFVPLPLRIAPSRAVRQPRSVQWKIASKRGLLRRFRHFIESDGGSIPHGLPRGERVTRAVLFPEGSKTLRSFLRRASIPVSAIISADIGGALW